MNGYATLPPGYGGGFNQGYMGGQQYMGQMAHMPQNMVQTPQNQAPAQQPRQHRQPEYICVPVSSREEAMGVRNEAYADATFAFDLAHGYIMVKWFNPATGMPETHEFQEIVAMPQEKVQNQTVEAKNQPADTKLAYVSREDFRKLCEYVYNLQEELNKLKKPQEVEDAE